jgi:hypothetical protein
LIGLWDVEEFDPTLLLRIRAEFESRLQRARTLLLCTDEFRADRQTGDQLQRVEDQIDVCLFVRDNATAIKLANEALNPVAVDATEDVWQPAVGGRQI